MAKTVDVPLTPKEIRQTWLLLQEHKATVDGSVALKLSAELKAARVAGKAKK